MCRQQIAWKECGWTYAPHLRSYQPAPSSSARSSAMAGLRCGTHPDRTARGISVVKLVVLCGLCTGCNRGGDWRHGGLNRPSGKRGVEVACHPSLGGCLEYRGPSSRSGSSFVLAYSIYRSLICIRVLAWYVPVNRKNG